MPHPISARSAPLGNLPPNVAHLSLRWPDCYKLKLPDKTLGSLAVLGVNARAGIPAGELLDCLQHCPNLRTLRLKARYLYFPPSSANVDPLRVHLLGLHSLELVLLHNDSINMVLDSLDCPMLSHVYIAPLMEVGRTVPCLEPVRDALNRLHLLRPSPSRLQSLTIGSHRNEVEADALFAVLAALSSLRRLRLLDALVTTRRGIPSDSVNMQPLISLPECIDIEVLTTRKQDIFEFEPFLLSIEGQLDRIRKARESGTPEGVRRTLKAVTVTHPNKEAWNAEYMKAANITDRLKEEHGVVVDRFLVDARP
ncbi:hypothetical protein NMY22_g11034 [Coprinellus aureogranulatus]|nr:hypothetical protein NMY22_g11034 [Coprinellus aureogranulatus]